MHPTSRRARKKEVEIIELLSSDEEDYGPAPAPAPPAAAGGPARAVTPAELAAPGDAGSKDPGEHDHAIHAKIAPTAVAAVSAIGGRVSQQHLSFHTSRLSKISRSDARRKRKRLISTDDWEEEEKQPAPLSPVPAVAQSPSGAGPSRLNSPGNGYQRSVHGVYTVTRRPEGAITPKPAPEEAVAGPSSVPAAAPAPAALALAAPELPDSFSSPAVASIFQVMEDVLGGLMSDREGGGGGAVAEVLAGLLRRFRRDVPLDAAIPQDMFNERKQELIDEMMESHLAGELRAAKEALTVAEAELESVEKAGAAQAEKQERETAAALTELEEVKAATAARAGELERELKAAREELETARAGASKAAKLKEEVLVMRGEARAAEKRACQAERELAATREELRTKEEAEQARTAAASGLCGASTPSDAPAEGLCADAAADSDSDSDEDDDAAKASPPPPPLRAGNLPTEVISQAVWGLNNLAATVEASVQKAIKQRDLPRLEPPERLEIYLETVEKLKNAGKVVLVEPNVWAEGADAALRWPGFSYSPRSHWAGVEVPVLDSTLVKRLKKAGMCAMEAGLRTVLGGSVAYPLLITRKLIDGGKGWGLRALCPISAGSCIIAYHGEYMTQEEADDVADAMRGRSAHSCFSFTLQACASLAAARTPAQLATFIRDEPSGPFLNLHSCVLDSRRRGNASRFFNHSCVPNCTSHEVDVPHGPTMAMQFALRDIETGEELTLDYAQGWSPKDLQVALRAWQKGDDHQKCRCGHAKCRGWCF